MTRPFLALLGCAMILLSVRDVCGQYHRRSGRGDGRPGEERRDGPSRSRTPGSGEPGRYRFKTAHERLPKGLPDWFVEKDTNQDGQVTMAEFANQWTDRLVEEFGQLDGNGDGIVTPRECLAARDAGAVSGSSGSTASASKSSPVGPPATTAGDGSEPAKGDAPPGADSPVAASPQKEAEGDPAAKKAEGDLGAKKAEGESIAKKAEGESSVKKAEGDSAAKDAAAPAAAEQPADAVPDAVGQDPAGQDDAAPNAAGPDAAGRDATAKTGPKDSSPPPDVEIPEDLLKHAISYIRMYDKDGNGNLTADEWKQMRKSPQAADLDGDGSVTAREYALWRMKS